MLFHPQNIPSNNVQDTSNVNKNITQVAQVERKVNFTKTQPGVFIKCKIDGINVLGLIDTGSDSTIISEELSNKLNTDMLNNRSNIIIGIGGQTVAIGEKEAEISISYDDISRSAIARMVVVSHLGVEALIGRDVIAACNIIINVASNKITINDEEENKEALKPKIKHSSFIITTKSEVMRASITAEVPVQITDEVNMEGMSIIPLIKNGNKYGAKIESTLAEFEDKKGKLLIKNVE